MYEGETNEDILLVNLVICILKWVILKTRNYIKYNKSTYREAIVITNLKNELRSNIQMMIKNAEVRNLYNIMKLVMIGYIMNLVVLIVPFIVYCVKMYVYKLNMRDKI